MNFSDLSFTDHLLPGATQAIQTFENGWKVSVVAGPKDCGLYGILGEDTFEVGVFTPNGNLLEDVLTYQTPVQVTSVLHLVEML
jgi:hypothetical protein